MHNFQAAQVKDEREREGGERGEDAIVLLVKSLKQHFQPALLYLSPACIFSALITAAARGEIKDMFAFAPNAENEKKTKAAASKADKGVEKTTEEKKKDSDEEASPTGSNGSPTRRSTRGKKKN